MKEIRKILCPTDFSDASCEAIKMANDFAERFSAQLLFVHVVQPIMLLPDSEIVQSLDVQLYKDQLLKSMETRLAALIGKMISKELTPPSGKVYYGVPAKIICAVAEAEDVDLIVMSTHGMTGWRHYVQGSVAQKIIQHTRRPILLVHGLPPDGKAVDPAAEAAWLTSTENTSPLTLDAIP